MDYFHWKLNGMKRALFMLITILITSVSLFAQDKYFTKTGKLSFYSKAPLEDIEAINKSVIVVLDAKSGNLQFSMLMKGFEFEKAMMEEHFNESYAETDKYPKAEFKGQILNNSGINYTNDGVYNAKVKGILIIHGEAKEVESNGKLYIKGGKLVADAKFNIQLSDFKINIPSLVKDKISNTVQISVDCAMEPLKS